VSANVPKRRFQTEEAFQLEKDWVFELPLKADERQSIALLFSDSPRLDLNRVSDTTICLQVKNGTLFAFVLDVFSKTCSVRYI
jgi:hypothetical protein